MTDFFDNYRYLLISIVDLSVVYYLIYKILLLIRGTRAERMLIGLGKFFILYFIADYFDLVTVNWILGKFLGSVIILVIILFQEDIRRALIKVGVLGGSISESVHDYEQCLHQIASAAIELGDKKTGGLIVIKRNVGLEEYSENAVKLDAVVSKPLLISIFQNSSPIHDGAVIIEGNRITFASAVLPSTFNPQLSSNYGTRHRAAIGLSERTDAVVVVISEEHGNVSVVREGRISRELDQKGLFATLYRLTIFKEQRARRRIKTFQAVLGNKNNSEETAQAIKKIREDLSKS